ncbi:MAG: RNA-binding transcriptional accessory protein [Deltaproteobacteria bacterium]|nr:RNA-binding transcriptional accessory protein [Deltaproteobacteria bacterium]
MESDAPTFDPVPRIAADLRLPARGVAAVLDLASGGATVPFVARYRKEATGGLDEVAIRAILERHASVSELEKRRVAILEALAAAGKLDDALKARVVAAVTRAELEDLYLPFRPKRRTRATVARERGLEPLAARILAQPPAGDPVAEACAFADAERGVPDAEAALAGACDIVAETVSENAPARAIAREAFRAGTLAADVVKSKATGPTRFEQYYRFREPLASVPSHRCLAVRRGEAEGVLRVRVEIEEERLAARILQVFRHSPGSPFAPLLADAVADSLKRLLGPSVENEVAGEARERAERQAAEVFAGNLRELLLAPPLGAKAVIGVDPGLRTGCKCAAVAPTGGLAGHVTVFPHTEGAASRAASELAAFATRHRPAAIAVGNGTAGRETEAFVRSALAAAGMSGVHVVMVSEAGASVYSASDAAREEFPDLDLTVRGAISIARRLQDPLAELVKVEPRSIGVGQYQHDVDEDLLRERLDSVVEDCVNRVGVDLNTASAPLLAHVSGIGPTLARAIRTHREQSGPFRRRGDLKRVRGLGPKAFEQAAGFLRIRDGDEPLDASAVHPERYDLVRRIASDLGAQVRDLVGDASAAARIDVRRYAGGDVGEPTLRDIVAELARPGRDPRDTFEPPRFREDVRAIEDLAAGMELEGVVTNVAAFGAFVDLGVHQDGLVHVSELSDRFVRDPREVVSVGKRVRVRVLGVDLARRRISLSMKSPRSP